MSTSAPFALIRAIRFSDAKSSMCMPVFARHGENHLSVPICDREHSILGFNPIYDYSDSMIDIVGDYDRRYDYEVGEICPFLYLSNGSLSIISEESFELQVVELARRAASELICRELLDDLSSVAAVRQTRSKISDSQIDPLELSATDLVPKAARLWLDESIRDVRLMVDSAESEGKDAVASIARLKLLSWAREFGENATSPMFRHFSQSISTLELSGIYVEDLLAVALLKRVTEDIPRGESARSLIGRFRAKYNTAPFDAAIELGRSGVDEFSKRANDVIQVFEQHVLEALNNRSIPDLLTVSSSKSSSAKFSDELIRRFDKVEQNHRAKIDEISEKILEARQEFEERKIRLRRLTNFNSRYEESGAMKSLQRDIVNNWKYIHSEIGILSAIKKAKEGTNDRDINSNFLGIDYSKIGVSRQFMRSLDRLVETWREEGEI